MSTIKSRIFIRVLFLLIFLTPSLSFAAGNIGVDGLNNLILEFANKVVRSTGYMMFTLAVVAFFFGIVQFIWSARQGAEGKGIQKGTQFMKWGLIALFVMFSVWGIVKFAQGVFGIQGDNTIIVPSLNFTQSGTSGVTGTTGTTGVANCITPNKVVNGICTTPAGAPVVNTGVTGSARCSAPNKIVNNVCVTPSGTPVTNTAGGNVTKKVDGTTCSGSSECNSGFCNTSNKCETVSAANKLPLTSSCYQDTQCSSNYCDNKGECAVNPNTGADSECYYSAANPNYLDGESCGSGSSAGKCKSAKCVTTASTLADEECYYSAANPNGADGANCGTGSTAGKCSGGMCVTSGSTSADNGCGPGNGYPDEFGNCPTSGGSGGSLTARTDCLNSGGTYNSSDNTCSGGSGGGGGSSTARTDCLNSGGTYNSSDNTCSGGSGGGGASELVSGCTDSTADNYNSSATVDDGSCGYSH